MFKRILVAIDDSQPAACALSAAAELALHVRAELILLHVVDTGSAYDPQSGRLDRARLAEVRREGNQLLGQIILQRPNRSNVERLMLEGDPAECILATAGNWPADLIVIGSDSTGRLAHFLLGHTADSVIRRATCPVMSVRADAERMVHKTMPARATA